MAEEPLLDSRTNRVSTTLSTGLSDLISDTETIPSDLTPKTASNIKGQRLLNLIKNRQNQYVSRITTILLTEKRYAAASSVNSHNNNNVTKSRLSSTMSSHSRTSSSKLRARSMRYSSKEQRGVEIRKEERRNLYKRSDSLVQQNARMSFTMPNSGVAEPGL